MKFNVFCCKNDRSLHLKLQSFSSVNILDIRSIDGRFYLDNSIILISEHSTNKRLIQYIRSINVLTPIYIVSFKQVLVQGANGCIHPNDLNTDIIEQQLHLFPQRHIWDFVFKVDQKKRNKDLKRINC
jgi:hypothetical protein